MGYSGGINPTAQKVPATYCGFEFFVLPLGQAIRCKGVNRVAVCVNVGSLRYTIANSLIYNNINLDPVLISNKADTKSRI